MIIINCIVLYSWDNNYCSLDT